MNKDPNSNIDRLFSQDNLHKNFKPSEADWMVVRDKVIAKKRDKKPFLIFFLGLITLIGASIIYQLLENNNQISTSILKEPTTAISNKDNTSENLVISKNNSSIEDDKTDLTFNKKIQKERSKKEVGQSSYKISSKLKVVTEPTKFFKEETDLVNQAAVLAFEDQSSKLNIEVNNAKPMDETTLSIDPSDEKTLEKDIFENEDRISLEETAFLNTLKTSLLINKKINVDQPFIKPLKPKKRDYHLSLSSDRTISSPAIILNTDVLNYRGLNLKAGLVYQYRDVQEIIISSQVQQFYTFGSNNSIATLALQNVHFGGVNFTPSYRIWQNLSLGLELNFLYRINARGEESYKDTNLSMARNSFNLANRYTNNFNIGIRPLIQYQINTFTFGLGYDQLMREIYASNEINSRQLSSSLFFEITKTF